RQSHSLKQLHGGRGKSPIHHTCRDRFARKNFLGCQNGCRIFAANSPTALIHYPHLSYASKFEALPCSKEAISPAAVSCNGPWPLLGPPGCPPGTPSACSQTNPPSRNRARKFASASSGPAARKADPGEFTRRPRASAITLQSLPFAT